MVWLIVKRVNGLPLSFEVSGEGDHLPTGSARSFQVTFYEMPGITGTLYSFWGVGFFGLATVGGAGFGVNVADLLNVGAKLFSDNVDCFGTVGATGDFPMFSVQGFLSFSLKVSICCQYPFA